jgi:mannitol/fructose-specific phosphotransferase system IIA component (Ntr-type)
VGITARILSERRKLDSPEGVTILSAAVIDDVLGIVLLAIVMGVLTASRAAGTIDWGHILVIGAKAVGVWLAATVVGLLAARKISFLLKWFGERTSIAVMALGLALVLAGLFEEAGLAMIIGAYVMGLSLSKADVSQVIREKLAPVYALLVPVFFCTMGMRIDFAAMASWPAVLFGLAYAGAALAAKVLGCGLPALAASFNLRGAARIGFGMAPRCEVALIIAGIGLSAGLLPAEIFAAVVVMVVVNTVLAPPALVGLFRSDARGTRRPVTGEKTGTTVAFDFPTIEMTEFFLAKLAAVFEDEGFFVHRIHHAQRPLYQMRKDTAVIDARCDGTHLEFDCRRADVPLVNAAVYEAAAALEQAVRGLKAPIDTSDIRSRVQDAGPLGPQTLQMANYLTPQLVEPHLGGETKSEVIEELLELLRRAGQVRDVEAARAAVWEREESMSTGLQYGVAIPHGKTDAVDHLVCAVGVKRDGMDFDALDGQPSRIFILTLSPKSKPAPHVQFMSTVSQILNPHGRQRILEARTAAEIHRAFTAPVPAAAPPPRPAPAARGKFSVSDYLSPDVLQPDLQGGTKEQVIRELIGLLDRAGHLRDAEAAARAVLNREEQMSTGMDQGVAVPHGRTEAVGKLVCAVGVKREGMDFGSADGRPTRILVLVLTPPGGADPYLQVVASVMAALDAEGRQRVLAARTPQEVYDALTRPAGK